MFTKRTGPSRLLARSPESSSRWRRSLTRRARARRHPLAAAEFPGVADDTHWRLLADPDDTHW